MATADSYIEVCERGSYEEKAEVRIYSLRVELKIARGTPAIEQLRAVVARCVDVMTASGVPADSISDDGISVNSGYEGLFRRRRRVTQTLRISASDPRRFTDAVAAFERLFDGKTRDYAVAMVAPAFEAKPQSAAAAQEKAMARAIAHAEVLAARAGVRLGRVLQITQVNAARETGGRYSEAMMGEFTSALSESSVIAAPTNLVTATYRVRFAVEPS